MEMIVCEKISYYPDEQTIVNTFLHLKNGEIDARNGGTLSPLVIFSKRRTQGVSMPTQRMIISQAKRSVYDVMSCFGNSLHSSTTRTEIPYMKIRISTK